MHNGVFEVFGTATRGIGADVLEEFALIDDIIAAKAADEVHGYDADRFAEVRIGSNYQRAKSRVLAIWSCVRLKDAQPLFVGEAAVGDDTNVN